MFLCGLNIVALHPACHKARASWRQTLCAHPLASRTPLWEVEKHSLGSPQNFHDLTHRFLGHTVMVPKEDQGTLADLRGERTVYYCPLRRHVATIPHHSLSEEMLRIRKLEVQSR